VKTRKPRKAAFLPWMMTDLMLSSWETIAHRTLLMAQNTCSPAEYQRMVSEKTQAAVESGMKLVTGNGSVASLMTPWLKRTKANAKRLRKKK
jgi:hypothetical protein